MFEKIFFTYLLVSIILSIIALMLADVWEYAGILAIPFLLAILFIVGYYLAKLGCLIWGYNLDLFPSVGVRKG